MSMSMSVPVLCLCLCCVCACAVSVLCLCLCLCYVCAVLCLCLGWVGLGWVWSKPGLGPLLATSVLHFGVASYPQVLHPSRGTVFWLPPPAAGPSSPLGLLRQSHAGAQTTLARGALPLAWFPALASTNHIKP